MIWKKLGRLFCPENRFPWMVSHSANPVAWHLGNGIFRVFFSCRDKDNRSSIGTVDFDIRDPHKTFNLSETPVLEPGEIGTFDDSGSSMSCLVEAGGVTYLYYLGWNLGVTVPWRNSIGLAVKKKGSNHFQRISQAPVADRCDADPYSVSYPWVIREGGLWRMWYGSNLKWGAEQKDMAHLIKYASSQDGQHWDRQGKISVDFNTPDEYALSKPFVLKEKDKYRMWYSHRGAAYRIGYAESGDGIHFTRKDEMAGIGVSESGWDSESVEYPNLFDYGGSRYLLYNGNRYGLTGFGLAVLEKE